MGKDLLDEEREALIRKHGIPLPLFRAFLKVFGKKYRGKCLKERGHFNRYRGEDPWKGICDVCGCADSTVTERTDPRTAQVIHCCNGCAEKLAGQEP